MPSNPLTPIKALLRTNRIVRPFADGYLIGGQNQWEWYEEHIFNETRLYKALGKDDARSVLGVWRRFREVCELLEGLDKASCT